MFYFVTQELCDEAALYIGLRYNVNVRIVKSKTGVEISTLTPNTVFPIHLVANAYIEYLHFHFLEEGHLLQLQIALICGVRGTFLSTLQFFDNFKDN